MSNIIASALHFRALMFCGLYFSVLWEPENPKRSPFKGVPVSKAVVL